MLWRVGLLIAVTVLAFGWSIVERVRYLRLKTTPLAERHPADHKPTEADRQAWNQAIRERLRAMSIVQGRADGALFLGLGSGLAAVAVVLRAKRNSLQPKQAEPGVAPDPARVTAFRNS